MAGDWTEEEKNFSPLFHHAGISSNIPTCNSNVCLAKIDKK
jgi:hypothetical protein